MPLRFQCVFITLLTSFHVKYSSLASDCVPACSFLSASGSAVPAAREPPPCLYSRSPLSPALQKPWLKIASFLLRCFAVSPVSSQYIKILRSASFKILPLTFHTTEVFLVFQLLKNISTVKVNFMFLKILNSGAFFSSLFLVTHGQSLARILLDALECHLALILPSLFPLIFCVCLPPPPGFSV